MAEEKKDAKKDDKKAAPKKGNTFEDVILLILGLITIFFVIIPQLAPPAEVVLDSHGQPVETPNSTKPATKGIAGIYNNVFGEKTKQVVGADGRVTEVVVGPSVVEETKFRLADILSGVSTFIVIVSIFLSALFGLIWYYNKLRLSLIVKEYTDKLGLTNTEKKEVKEVKETKIPDNLPVSLDYVPDTNGIINPKWELVEKYYNSGNPSDWRIAIIEADILLFEALQASGFPGDTIGEMLKGANTAQLQSLQTAWKSHLIRNRLAHEGASMQLTRQTVEVAIEGFRTVFTELNFI